MKVYNVYWHWTKFSMNKFYSLWETTLIKNAMKVLSLCLSKESMLEEQGWSDCLKYVLRISGQHSRSIKNHIYLCRSIRKIWSSQNITLKYDIPSAFRKDIIFFWCKHNITFWRKCERLSSQKETYWKMTFLVFLALSCNSS